MDARFVDLLAGFQTTYGAQLIGCTVMRIRGRFSYLGDATSVTVPMTAGIRVFDDSEFLTLGVANGPTNDPHADWMYYNSIYQQHGAIGATGQPTVGYEDFDVRSRRKVEELGQGLLWALTNSGAASRTGTLQCSVLLALP